MAVKIADLAKGTVDIETDVLAKCAGMIASLSYGVVGMAYRSKTAEFANLLKKDSLTKGIKVECIDSKLYIDMHIIVDYGVNINTVCNSIISNVKYQINRMTDLEVENVDIYVEGFRLQE